jgi:hypothetical protein
MRLEARDRPRLTRLSDGVDGLWTVSDADWATVRPGAHLSDPHCDVELLALFRLRDEEALCAE